MRRHVTLGLVLVVVLAGCGGGGADESTGPPLTGTATAAELTDDARTEAGLTERRRTTGQLNTTVSATIQGDVELRTTRRANVTTVSVSYDGGESEREGVVFGTYSVPAVQPFERANLTKNPADGLDPAALATRAQHRYEVRATTEVGQTTTTVLGTETTATRYEATAGGDEQRLFVTVATVRHANDYVTAVVVVPTGASAPTATLFGGVTH
jgi:hypothetical protein